MAFEVQHVVPAVTVGPALGWTEHLGAGGDGTLVVGVDIGDDDVNQRAACAAAARVAVLTGGQA